MNAYKLGVTYVLSKDCCADWPWFAEAVNNSDASVSTACDMWRWCTLCAY